MRRARVWVLPAAAWAVWAAWGAGAAAAAPAASGVVARLEAPSGEITVGDPVVLTLRVTHPPGTVVDLPDAAGAFASLREPSEEGAGEGGVPLVMVDEVRPLAPGGTAAAPGQTAWSIRLRLFKPGENRLPPIGVSYRLPSSSGSLQVATQELALQVKSVLKRSDEAAAGNKGQWKIPFDWLSLLLWSAAIALMGALLLEAIRRLRRRRRPEAVAPPAPPAPVVPAWERALADLERLLASRLLAEGKIKEFHVSLSEIVKRFLGDRYGFDALDRTTLEVLADLSRAGVVGEVRDLTRVFLEACDLVKFAKHRPATARIDETVAAARHVIETGRPAPAAEGVKRSEAAA